MLLKRLSLADVCVASVRLPRLNCGDVLVLCSGLSLFVEAGARSDCPTQHQQNEGSGASEQQRKHVSSPPSDVPGNKRHPGILGQYWIVMAGEFRWCCCLEVGSMSSLEQTRYWKICNGPIGWASCYF